MIVDDATIVPAQRRGIVDQSSLARRRLSP